MVKREKVTTILGIAIFLVVVLLIVIILSVSGVFGPPASQLRVNEGKDLYRQGRIEEAIDKYSEAIKMEREWEGPYLFRGIASTTLVNMNFVLRTSAKSYDSSPRGGTIVRRLLSSRFSLCRTGQER